MTPESLEAVLRGLLASGQLDLPLPASGDTRSRLGALMRIAAEDLQVARMVEAHTDATAILHEAGRTPAEGCLYGVWAAEDPRSSSPLRLEGESTYAAVSGEKPFCTGAGIVDRALVTVREGAHAYLIDLDVRSPEVSFDVSTWRTSAFGATNTAIATFKHLVAGTKGVVGAPNWYLDRPGFWHGACAPAACWAGGMIGLIDRAFVLGRVGTPSPHRDANLGALDALRWMVVAVVDRAGEEIDAWPNDGDGAYIRAFRLRHLVERAATAAIDHVGRALGPRPLIEDCFVVERVAELQVYIRQQHAEQDLAALSARLHRAREHDG